MCGFRIGSADLCDRRVRFRLESSLVNEILYKIAGEDSSNRARTIPGKFTAALKVWSSWTRSSDIDQSPIGRTPRSNPATYTGVFDHDPGLCSLRQSDAKAKGYTKKDGSAFNVKGGRCEACWR